MAVIGLILGFHAVKLTELSFCAGARTAFSVAVLSGLALLFVALGRLLWGMRVRESSTFPNAKDLWGLAAAANDDEAKKLAIQVYLDLRDAIKATNNQRALAYRTAGYLLLAGFVLCVLGQLGLGLKFL
jgi:hypothetical protein